VTTLLSVQILRAVAALAVVAHHVQLDFVTRLGLPDALPDLNLGAAGVDVFFVISGFVMVYASEPLFGRSDGAREFWLRRLIRIVPLYWAVTSLYLVLTLLFPDMATSRYSPALIAASYLFFPFPREDGVMQPVAGLGWTLNYEMFFYLVFGLGLAFQRKAAVAAVAVALTLAAAWGWATGPVAGAVGFWTDPIILEFVFGMTLALAVRAGWRLRPVTAVFLMGAGLVMLAFAFPMRLVTGLPRGLAWGLPVALFVAGAVLGDFRRSDGALARALGAIGDASYSLYLLHPFVIRFAREFWSHGLIDAAAWPWAYAALVIAGSIGTALASYRLFERPVTRALQAWLARPRRGALLRAEAPARP
jgi:exopolysaccharide production protein ExoZ